MASSEIVVSAPPDRVFGVLADASRDAEWVVGAEEVVDADAPWPDQGSELAHRSGVGAMALADTTEVLEAEPPRRLLLLARLSRLGDLRVELMLEPDGERTRVRMAEEPIGGPLATLHNSLTDAAPAARNTLSLRRLRDLAEA